MKQDNSKKLEAFQSPSLREMLNQANSRSITKEDIVQVINSSDGGFFLLYYK